MKSQNNVLADLLDFDTPDASQDVLWSAGMPHAVSERDGYIGVELDFLLRLLTKRGSCQMKIPHPKDIPCG